jgi:predicted ArsR family transcriptional regulator
MENLEFEGLLQEVGFSHNTLRRRLASLERQRLILKAKKPQEGPGRPIFTYSLPPKLKAKVALSPADSYISPVTISFRKLRHLCRFEKGGYCKEAKKNCAPQNCPQIRK